MSAETGARRFRRSLPHMSGWWLWKKHLSAEPEKLLVDAANRPCIASDEQYARATKQDYPLHRDDNYNENFWEGTACREMGGFWQVEVGFDINKEQP